MTSARFCLRPPMPDCLDCGDDFIVPDSSAPDGSGTRLCRCRAYQAPEPALFTAPVDTDDLPF